MEVKYIILLSEEDTSLGELPINEPPLDGSVPDEVQGSTDSGTDAEGEVSSREDSTTELDSELTDEGDSSEPVEGMDSDEVSLDEGLFGDDFLNEDLTIVESTELEDAFFTKDFSNYTVTEGLLLLIFIILFCRFCIDMTYKILHWRMF